MKKEKKVRQYTRKTKSGKTVIVKAHTAKYDAADKAKEIAKKKGAGEELEERKKKKPTQLEIPFDFDKEEEKKVLDEIKDTEKKASKKVRPVGSGTNGPTPKKKSEEKATKKTKAETSEPAFTAAEFKEWYRGTGSAADKKVAKALRAQLGRAGYRKLEDEAIDNYSSRGHLSMFKRVSGGSEAKTKTSLGGKAAKEKDTSTQDFKVKDSAIRRIEREIKKLKSPKKMWVTPDRSKNIARYVKERLDTLEKAKEYLANGDRLKAAELLVDKHSYVGSYKPEEFYSKDEIKAKTHNARKSAKETSTKTPKSKAETEAKSSKADKVEVPKKKEPYANYRALAKKRPSPTPPKSYDPVAKDKESKDRASKISEGTKGIDASMKKLPSGVKALTGKDATAAKKVLMNNGYEVLRIDGKTFLKKGNSTYEYKSAGLRLGGAMLKKGKIPTTSSSAKPEKKSKREELSSVSGQVSYVRNLSKKLPEDKRKVLAPLLSRASTGQISTQSLWNTYQKLRSKGKRYMTQPAPWDKRAFEDLANSD